MLHMNAQQVSSHTPSRSLVHVSLTLCFLASQTVKREVKATLKEQKKVLGISEGTWQPVQLLIPGVHGIQPRNGRLQVVGRGDREGNRNDRSWASQDCIDSFTLKDLYRMSTEGLLPKGTVAKRREDGKCLLLERPRAPDGY